MTSHITVRRDEVGYRDTCKRLIVVFVSGTETERYIACIGLYSIYYCSVGNPSCTQGGGDGPVMLVIGFFC